MEKRNLLLLVVVVIVSMFFISTFTGYVSKQNNFNLKVEIPETYEDVLAGNNIWFTTKVLNLAGTNRADITLKYEILDVNKELKASKTETVAVETQASFVGNLKVPKNLEKGIYFLKVILISSFGESEAETSFNVIKEETNNQVIIKISLFDIQATIPDAYKRIYPGDELLTNIKLVNLGSAGRIDVFLEYWITNSEYDILLEKKETVAVETQANFIKTFDIPKDAKSGKYYFYAKIIYGDGKEATATHSFEVVKDMIDKELYYLLVGLISLIALIYITFKFKPLFERLQIRIKISKIIKKRMKTQSLAKF